MSHFCHSCTMPLSDETRRADTAYCLHCSDESGALQPREAVQQGIAGWMRSWQGDISDEQAMARAGHFMKGMPAWAED